MPKTVPAMRGANAGALRPHCALGIDAARLEVDLAPRREKRPWGGEKAFDGVHGVEALAEICRATGVIVLDQDLVVLRNIDHLSGAPTPGVVMQHSPSFAGYCFPAAVNSGLMVLEPSTAVFRRAFDGLQNRSRFKPRRNDKSDQDVWRVLLPTVHGLLIGYNALKYANLVSPAEWSQIHVLHDAWQNLGSRWWNRGNGSAVYTEVMRLSRQSDKYLWARANASASSARADGLWWRSESDQKWIRAGKEHPLVA
ncbi:hypothetical protein EMIHUDRAFT_251201 [Emiliania huxleyi CCMP1516]|uniref:Nucleotide-diphospho-sugar transferase domain-containing protein n=2 Tax=Emiliania huxleyi TaxID=2903 RepID=A0A0D3KWZ0_EMIH1|nr:hypothetical protein EMIHUDRAFT_251201 [Emiliania huxleyi CCMP1516]EOD40275.1 hypothetical protein EMIHUDRAFT_251201 [Emiliania huxleyi CCMP1516]|eukprot:XP_005792704.1 hypothetical protein EMIHUDRAFT_251201 [Emiliania huxleyi CCMP1516]